MIQELLQRDQVQVYESGHMIHLKIAAIRSCYQSVV